MTRYLLLLGFLIVLSVRLGRGATGTITGKVIDPRTVDVRSRPSIAPTRRTRSSRARSMRRRARSRLPGLPLGKTFDVVVDAGPVRLEGVNLKVPRSDFEEEQPLAKADIEALDKAAKLLNKFEDEIEIMTITGNIQHAAVLMNKLRTQPFYESKPGEVIWRLELWRFEKPEETWVKVQDDLFLSCTANGCRRRDFEKKP